MRAFIKSGAPALFCVALPWAFGFHCRSLTTRRSAPIRFGCAPPSTVRGRPWTRIHIKYDAADSGRDEDELFRALREQRAQLRRERRRAQRDAIHEANRRTYPREAMHKRIEEGERRRKRREREKLKKSYVEKKERLDTKKRNERRYLEERERQREVLEGKAGKRSETVDGDTPASGERARGVKVGEDAENASPSLPSGNDMRGIPVLDRPYVDARPLLVGSSLVLRYSDLTPFQRRSIDVARERHREHGERMKAEEASKNNENDEPEGSPSREGGTGGVQAAPIIAVVDGYTAAATDSLQWPPAHRTSRRYATLASIEIVEDNTCREPAALKLMGVGRAFLRDYFSSREAFMSSEEEELSKLIAQIEELDRPEFHEGDDVEEHLMEPGDDEDEDEDEEDGELPVVMAEFDLLLDDSSASSSKHSTKYGDETTKHRASSMHAITELYRCAHRVYRLHEERRKLVAGLRTGEARLRHGRMGGARPAAAAAAASAYDENCSIEFEDCDGLGSLLIKVLDDESEGLPRLDETPALSGVDAPPRSCLETMENYGLGSYGALSPIPDLARQLMVRLEPYYSPAHREREEHEAEVALYVVLKSLEAYASPAEVAEMLVVPSSATERLGKAYGIMMRHRDELAGLAETIGRELAECGEECTDLW